jgi:FkbM family methyltransferase
MVDIGANDGDSAISFGSLCRRWEVVSFEPIPWLCGELDFVRRILGERFSYHNVGLADEPGELSLSVPRVGDQLVTGEASFLSKEDVLSDPYMLDRLSHLGDAVTIETTSVEVRTLDSYVLSPQVVKIDVQGFELRVLKGMLDTIRRSRPTIIMERSPHYGDIEALLAGVGYRIYSYDADRDALVEPISGGLNVFAVPAA